MEAILGTGYSGRNREPELRLPGSQSPSLQIILRSAHRFLTPSFLMVISLFFLSGTHSTSSVGQEGNPLFPHTASASLEFFRRLLGSVVRVQAAAGVWIKPRITPRVLGPSALLTNRTAPHLPAAPTSVNQSSSPPQFSFGILQDRF